MRKAIAALILAFASTSALAEPESGVGYPTVQLAVSALRADPEAKGGLQNGWYVIYVEKGINEGIWHLTSQQHSAHPSAVRRLLKDKDGQLFIDMRILCGGEKTVCDQLADDSRKMNEQIASDVKAKQKKQ